ncbi:PAS domain S-box protein [Neobacillus sp. SM06]|uniref:PAS domain S-box protein n=1 Tax=Neobacillus sp. SM06 TaxID=3422492 RepID=UPI003D2B6D07
MTAIKRWAVLLTSFFIISYELLRHEFILQKISSKTDMVISSVLFIIGAFVFSEFLFGYIKKIENQRIQQEREAKALFDNSIDGIFVFQTNGYLVDMNQGAEEMSGWRLKDVQGKLKFESIFYLESSTLSLQAFLKGKQTSVRIENGLLIAKDGAELPISATFSQIHNDYMGDTKIAFIVRDLTQQKQMADIIKGLYQEATQKQFEAETQYWIANKLASIRELTADNRQQIFQNVAEEIKKLLNCCNVGLFLNNFSKDHLDTVAVTNLPQQKNMMRSLERAKYKKNFGKGQVLTEVQMNGQKSFTYPLCCENLVLGYLWVSDKKDRVWSLHQQELLKSIINILTISLENLTMYQKMKDIATLEERERLAREMHDGLAQNISSIHMKIELIKKLAISNQGNKREILQNAVLEVSQIVNEAYQEVRQNLFNLMSPFYSEGEFFELLKNYINQFQELNQIDVEFSNQLQEQNKSFELSESKKIQVVRILQEALSNVRRHSKCKKAFISIFQKGDGAYVITVEDKGIGFLADDLQTTNHYGLRTMKDRANLIKGNLVIQTKPNAGTKVELTIPAGGDDCV